MEQEYTPTTEKVKQAYSGLHEKNYYDFDATQREENFDRWLAAHDAQIRAEAWTEGRQRGWMDGVGNAESASPNPYRKENRLYKSNGLQSEEKKQ